MSVFGFKESWSWHLQYVSAKNTSSIPGGVREEGESVMKMWAHAHVLVNVQSLGTAVVALSYRWSNACRFISNFWLRRNSFAVCSFVEITLSSLNSYRCLDFTALCGLHVCVCVCFGLKRHHSTSHHRFCGTGASSYVSCAIR